MYPHRETIKIKLTHNDTKKMAHDYGGPSQRQASGTIQRINILRQGRH